MDLNFGVTSVVTYYSCL